MFDLRDLEDVHDHWSLAFAPAVPLRRPRMAQLILSS